MALAIDRLGGRDAIFGHDLKTPFPVLEISNTVNNLDTIFERAEADKTLVYELFPKTNPPWSLAWFDWKDPRQHLQIGASLSSADTRLLAHATRSFKRIGIELDPATLRVLRTDAARATHFSLVSAHLWVAGVKHDQLPRVFYFGYFSDSTGAILKESSFSAVTDGDGVISEAEFLKREGFQERWLTMVVGCQILYAIGLCHCKNIVRVEKKPDARLQKNRLRKHRPLLTTYEVLTIDPGLTRKTTGVAEPGSGEMPWHIARGSFATYTPERPLFGKYVGTFWRPMHVKGNRKHGVRVKDYVVKDSRPRVDS